MNFQVLNKKPKYKTKTVKLIVATKYVTLNPSILEENKVDLDAQVCVDVSRTGKTLNV